MYSPFFPSSNFTLYLFVRLSNEIISFNTPFHTLHDLFSDVKSGELAAHLNVLGKSLLSHVLYLYSEIDTLKSRLDTIGSKEDKA